MATTEKVQLNISLRVTLAFGAALTCFFIIALRLWYLQVLRGDYFRDRSENNRLRTIYIPPPRGLIFDRNGEVLVKTRPSFNIELVTEDCPEPKETIRKLAKLLKYDETVLLERLRDQRKRRRFESRLLLKDISRDTVATVLAHRWELPGVIVNVVPTRNYEYKTLASHVLGYIREITRSQLDDPRYAGYQMNDEIGQYGIEAKWEQYLQGTRGVQNVIVNATGSKVGDFSFEPEVGGRNLTLTLDLKVQRAADDALVGKRGAIVALDPRTGEVLAMSSSPAFDPNIFTGDISSQTWKELTMGEAKILNNRALQGTFAPGSVWKVFMAAAGLTEHVMGENDVVSCPGFYMFGGRPFKCWKHSGHGGVDLKRAITVSCDVYFYTLGQRLGIERMHKYASMFGLGQRTAIELPHEAPGLVPSPEWKALFFKNNPANQKWFPGETISVAIGQGAVTLTPLQVARGMAALINGGKLLVPELVKKIEGPERDGTFLDTDFHPKLTRNIDIDKRILKKVIDGMISVVNDPSGTGGKAKLPKELNITVAGKTGTAQSSGGRGDHAWFAGFAPAEDPGIVVAAVVEHGGHGGSTAAPLVEKVMEAYFGYVPPVETPVPTPVVMAKRKIADGD